MTRKEIADLFKRFLITFCCCMPVFIGFGFLLSDKLKDWIMAAVFVCVGGCAFALEEYIHYKKWLERQKAKKELNKSYKKEQEE